MLTPHDARTLVKYLFVTVLCCIPDGLMGPRAWRQLAVGEAPGAWTKEAYGQLPLSFESNRGQTNEQVKFLARGRGYNLFLTSTEAVLSVATPRVGEHHLSTDTAVDTRSNVPQPAVVRMKLVEANPEAAATGQDPLHGRSNYLIGSDPSRWRTNIPHYRKVRYQSVYSGVDLVYYGNQGQLEYDFQVAAGVDPSVIRVSFEGARQIRLGDEGDLVITVGSTELRQLKPVAYQEVDGYRQEVPSGYRVEGTNRVRFELGLYDATRPLVIDPVLVYSTHLGGSMSDIGFGIAVDTAGHAYVTGRTLSSDFPTSTDGVQPGFNGGIEDVFVTKVNREGSALIYSTYLGGTFFEHPFDIAVDKHGSAYVTGTTASSDFPTTIDAFQQTLAGEVDVFVTKLSRDGSALAYSTYLGGTAGDRGLVIAVDEDRHAYVSGDTSSSDFPVTVGAFQETYANNGDVFVTKLNRSGSRVAYSTYLGGSVGELAEGIAVDENGNAYIGGGTSSPDFPTTSGAFQRALNGVRDIFVTKLNRRGSGIVYSTYLGGDDDDHAFDIAVDGSGAVYVTGYTRSLDFPTTADVFQPTFAGPEEGEFRSDAFVTKLNRRGSALVYSTFLGGGHQDGGDGIAVDQAGRAYITGVTESPNFPTVDAVQPALAGTLDAFVTKLNRRGSAVVYSTYLGGSSNDFGRSIAVDKAGSAYVTGDSGADFPTTTGGFQPTSPGSGDAFVAKIGAARREGHAGRID
jgi:hypothetical protein